MVQFRAAFGRAPFGMILRQLDIKPVEPAGRPDVKRAFADLLDGGETRKRQEETEMIWKVGIVANDRRLVACQIFRLEINALRGQYEFRLGLPRGRAFPHRFERVCDIPLCAALAVAVVGLDLAAPSGLFPRPSS